MEIKIDPEFENLIPEQTLNEVDILKASILKHGCLSPLILWNNTLIDGHTRYTICTANHIEYKTIQMEFKDRNEVILFIIDNQLGKRNLEPYQKFELVKHKERIFQERAKENQKEAGANNGNGKKKLSTTSYEAKNPVNVLDELSKDAGLSRDTIHKARTIDKNAPEEVKEKLRKGETTINAEYRKIKPEPIKRVPAPNLPPFMNPKEEKIFKLIIEELKTLAKDNGVNANHEYETFIKYLKIELSK